jgi:adenylate kinase
VNTVIFVCGVSGVGKTHLLRTFVASQSRVTTLSAGAIIAAARKIADPEFLRSLSQDELMQNQELLIKGFNQAIPGIDADLVLIDGHVLVEQASGGLYQIATDVFRAFCLRGIVHVEDDPSTIAKRRASDQARIRPRRSVEDIMAYQEASRARAITVGIELSVTTQSVRAGDDRELFRILAPFCGSTS